MTGAKALCGTHFTFPVMGVVFSSLGGEDVAVAAACKLAGGRVASGLSGG